MYDNEEMNSNATIERNSNSQQIVSDKTPNSPKRKSPKDRRSYVGWNLYFIDKEYTRTDPLLDKVETMEKFLEINPHIIISNIKDDVLNIDVNLLYTSDIFTEDWPDFQEELKNKPQFVLNCLGLAAHQVRYDAIMQKKITGIFDAIGDIYLKIHIANFGPVTSLNDIKVDYRGKFVTVRGQITKISKSCQLATALVMICSKCRTSYEIKLENGIYKSRGKCENCGAMKFDLNLSSPQVETITKQVVRIQEHFGDEKIDRRGSIPRMMDVELLDELTDKCMAGDSVMITGIIKLDDLDNGKVKTNSNTSSCLYIEANNLINTENNNKNNEAIAIELTISDYRIIQGIHANKDILRLLVRSLWPTVYGHEIIKMALLLSLFGGTNASSLRANIHVLIVGDPGLGKSQLLQACSQVAPKGIYLCGSSSSSSGLTVTLVREKGENDFALEPGALVLADKGCCCIDEFDKMSKQHLSLLEAMEQQCVSVAKSGVIWSLPARTCILAAANPIGGKYDKTKLLTRNLSMSQPLLSRFDLIYLLLDKPDKNQDDVLAGHVMQLHTGNEATAGGVLDDASKDHSNSSADSLKDRLTRRRDDTAGNGADDNVSQTHLRKYLAYARQYVNPKLTSESADVLKDYYMTLRATSNSATDMIPCARQLEALVRLTQARAKLDLREETTAQDALEIVQLMEHTVLGMRNHQLDCITVNTTNKSARGAKKKFIDLLQQHAEEARSRLFSTEQLRNFAIEAGYTNADIDNAIDKLNNEGFIVKTSSGTYKFL